jgi:hypothetical protein
MSSLALTGSFFCISGYTAYQYNNLITAYLSFLLAFTSVWYHTYRIPPAFILDQIAIFGVVFRSFIDGYNGGVPGLTISIITNTYNYIVFFSPASKWCCFHPVNHTGIQWHSTLHIAAVISIILQQIAISQSQQYITS